METWSVHQLFRSAQEQLGEDAAADLQKYAADLIARGFPVITTLGHLAHITRVDSHMLHETVARRREVANYQMYAIRKRYGGRRFIHAVNGELLTVQGFINNEILQRAQPHPSSLAYHRGGGIRQCAQMHCGCRWLFQFDLKDFFWDVTEVDVYHIFCSLGYRALLSFEMARICTTTRMPSSYRHMLHRRNHRCDMSPFAKRHPPYFPMKNTPMGVLPQGAPSSPMLANLAARGLDESLSSFARDRGLVYTRYADDLTFSSIRDSVGEDMRNIRRNITSLIRRSRFKVNVEKTRVARPGAKKLVLGLLVDGDNPRSSREMRHRVDRLLHAVVKYGLGPTAAHEKFESAIGLYNHLSGLMSFFKDVDRPMWQRYQLAYEQIPPPLNA